MVLFLAEIGWSRRSRSGKISLVIEIKRKTATLCDAEFMIVTEKRATLCESALLGFVH